MIYMEDARLSQYQGGLLMASLFFFAKVLRLLQRACFQAKY